MLNLYEEIRINQSYIKLEAGEFLFAEYTCPIEEKSQGIWTHTDYIVHVVSGKKIWHTPNESWTAESGQTIYFKKGAAVIEQFFDEDFCLLLFFIPDDFIIDSVKEITEGFNKDSAIFELKKPATRITGNPALDIFFKTMLTYFANLKNPSEILLKLKLKELILNILSSNSNLELKNYFLSFLNNKKPLLNEIMENNFKYNLTLENFAEMSHRSLSSFKRDFYKHFNESPGRWLLNKRLEYASVLLRTTNLSISQIIFECGFENISHFSNAFRNKFGIVPSKYKNQGGDLA
jgi:AraC family transcriptional regulator, exoenzyme S synthesis regulatory protein ExsA